MGYYINIGIPQCRHKFAFDGDDLAGTSNVLNSLVSYNNNTQIKHKYYGISTGKVTIGRNRLYCRKCLFGTNKLCCPIFQQG